MFKKSLVSGTLLPMLLVAASANATIMHEGARTNAAWRQEYTALGQQYDSVVGLYGYNGTQWQNIGSGVVISPHHVIGAAHSALGNNGQLFQNYGMVTGNHLVNDWWGGYYTTQVTIHPGFTDIIVSPDMAIWTFGEVIRDVTPATLYRGSDAAKLGSVVDLVGFGIYGYAVTGAIGLDGAKRGSQNELTRIGWPIEGAGSDQLIAHFCPPGDPDYQHLGGVVSSFDSGGGMFVDGNSTLFGVTDFRIGTQAYGYTGATSISQHVDWIDSVTAVPEPSSIVIFITGVASLLFYRRRRC